MTRFTLFLAIMCLVCGCNERKNFYLPPSSFETTNSGRGEEKEFPPVGSIVLIVNGDQEISGTILEYGDDFLIVDLGNSSTLKIYYDEISTIVIVTEPPSDDGKECECDPCTKDDYCDLDDYCEEK